MTICKNAGKGVVTIRNFAPMSIDQYKFQLPLFRPLKRGIKLAPNSAEFEMMDGRVECSGPILMDHPVRD